MGRFLSFYILLFCVILAVPFSVADTLLLRDGTEVKGLILNEYKDRIVVSTVSGEKYFMKSEIKSASYDSEARELLQKARNEVKRGEYIKAYYSYEKVVEMDPKIEEARERLLFLRKYLENKVRDDIRSGITRGNASVSLKDPKGPLERLKDKLGITLSSGGKYAYINALTAKAEAMGLKENDRIVSIWGEMTAFMDPEEVADLLLGLHESRLIVERVVPVDLKRDNSVSVKYDRIIGAKLDLERKGVVVVDIDDDGPFANAGIKKGDNILAVDGKDTTYMPMGTLTGMIVEDQGSTAEFVVRRDLILWDNPLG